MNQLSDEEIRVLEAIIDRGAVTLPRKGSAMLRSHHIQLYWTLDGLTLKHLLSDEIDEFTTVFIPTDLARQRFDQPDKPAVPANRGRWERDAL